MKYLAYAAVAYLALGALWGWFVHVMINGRLAEAVKHGATWPVSVYRTFFG